MFTVETVARLSEGVVFAGNPKQEIPDHAQVVIDSRKVKQDDLFVALVGEHHDAHRFIPQALANGAGAVMMSDPEAVQVVGPSTGVVLVGDTLDSLQHLASGYRAEMGVKVAAITGSCGKTTTKEMARRILTKYAPGHATRGNFNNHIGLPLTLLGIRPQHQWCVAEMGVNHPGEMAVLTGIAQPDVGLVTNVGDAHLAGLENREGVAREKGVLFTHVAKSGGTLVVNMDDPLVRAEAARYPDADRITFSSSADTEADVVVRPIANDRVRVRLADTIESEFSFFSTAPHQLSNAAAAAALSHSFGVKLDIIADSLSTFTPPAMRGRELSTPSGAHIVDDSYNANPDSMRAAIGSLAAATPGGRRIAVLGDMLELGDATAELHRKLGEMVAGTGIDRLICVGRLARHIADGASTLSDVRTADNQVDAASHLTDLAKGDLVLFKASRSMGLDLLVRRLSGDADDTERVA
ncbi:MAG: UDP-N-acetylmuramoyl-tripeptide--D-alanyl-D-alanine ligase [Leptospirillia bacterium]